MSTFDSVVSDDPRVYPAIRIDSNGLYFDKILVHTPDNSIFEARVTVSQDGEVFWEEVVADMQNIHIYDISAAAMTHFPFGIISTFSYNGEPAALFHVQYLFDVVNQFIIVESRYTISGARKPMLFFEREDTKRDFDPYVSKILYLVVDEIPPRPEGFIDPERHDWMHSVSYDAFWRDHYQREIVKQHVSPSAKNLFICTDADEIPRREVVAQFRNEQLYVGAFSSKVHLQMLMFYYNLNWVALSTWTHPFVANTDSYFALSDMIQARVANESERAQSLLFAGWHFSYFLSFADIVRKMESFPHREFDQAAFKSVEHVTACLATGKDIYMREDFKLYRIGNLEANSALFPQGWRELQHSLQELQGLQVKGECQIYQEGGQQISEQISYSCSPY